MSSYLDQTGLTEYNTLLHSEIINWAPRTTLTGTSVDVSTAKAFDLTLSSNKTLTFTGTPRTSAYEFWLVVNSTGSYSITWPSSVKWGGLGIPPLIEYGVYWLKFYTIDAGASWTGIVVYEEPQEWAFTIDTEATAAGEKTTGIPFNLYNQSGVSLTVDWGDGTSETLTASDYAVSDSRASVHEYADAGRYTVRMRSKQFRDMYVLTIDNIFPISSVNNAGSSLYWWRRTLVSVDKVIPKLAGKNYYDYPTSESSLQSDTSTLFAFLFAYCTSLTAIPAGLFDNNTAVTSFSYCFLNCTSLTTIHSGLFDSNTAVTNFEGCFGGCESLTAIPAGLFDNNTVLTNFGYCFSGCSSLTAIPAGLFDNNTVVTTFNNCFSGCSSLTAIPTGLFDNNTAVTNFESCFRNCSSLTTIPAGLFVNNTAVTSFSSCFYKCSSLIAIPAGLFDSNTAVINFTYCFGGGCSSLTAIPSGLFDNNTAVTNFSYCFRNCTSLTAIPAGLFNNNTVVTDFGYCFSDCTSLADFTLHIGSSSVSSCKYFVTKKSGTTRTVYVPSGSTTKTKFNAVATSLGLTIIGE